MEEKILYKDRDIIIYNKFPGEDSERISLESYPGAHVLSRLDKPVGGLIPLSISKNGNKAEFAKKYRAVVTGKVEESDVLEDFLYHDKRANKVYPVKKERAGVKKARLQYKLIAYDANQDLSLVDIELDTGRTHQIRVQFASRKHPLVGDRKYGSRIASDNIALQCYEIKWGTNAISLPKPDGFPWDIV